MGKKNKVKVTVTGRDNNVAINTPTFAPVVIPVDKSVRIIHMFDKHGDNPKGGTTIAYRPVLQDGLGNPRGLYAEVAVAYCRANERYSRKLGKYSVMEKFDNGETILLPIYELGHPVLFLKNIFSQDYTC